MRPILVVHVAAGTARAELMRNGRLLWAAESPFATPSDLREALAQLVSGESMPARPAKLRIRLDAPLAQVRSLHDLPPVRTRHLKALVAAQSERFFRRNGAPLVTDAAWAAGRRLGAVVLAAAAEEPWITAILEGAAAGGRSVESIRPAGRGAELGLELLSPAERRRRHRRARLAIGRLAVVAALLWASAAAVWAVRFDRERRAVDAEITRLRAPADAIMAARRALGESVELVDSLAAARRARAGAVTQLAALSASLPDSAYLTGLVFNQQGGGELSVVARHSAEVIAGLEQARGIVAPRIEGTALREAESGRDWERFSVRFGVPR